MKTITRISIFLLTFSWIVFLMTTIHFMKLAGESLIVSNLWFLIFLTIGVGSSMFSVFWIMDNDVWKSIYELKNERKRYHIELYHYKTLKEAYKIEMGERSLPFKEVEKRASDLEKDADWNMRVNSMYYARK